MKLLNFSDFVFEAVESKEEITKEMIKNAKDFLSWFDHIYVINLDSRKENMDHINKWCKDIGFNGFSRFSAYDGKANLEKDKKDLKAFLQKYKDVEGVDLDKIYNNENGGLDKAHAGQYACAESHRQCILDSIKKGYKRPLILEDDAVPAKALYEIGTKVIDQIKNRNYDLINFGHRESIFKDKYDGNGLIQTLQKGKVPTMFHAYTVHPNYYHQYLNDSLNSLYGHIDNVINAEGPNNGKKFLGVNPRLFVQIGNHSDIQNKVIRKGGAGEKMYEENK